MDLEIRQLQNALQRSGQDVVVLDRNLVLNLYTSLVNLTAYFSYDPNGRHYVCVFCDAESVHRGLLVHREGCFGEEAIKAIREAGAL